MHLTSPAYVPQSNGKVERLNRTLVEKTRAMLRSSNLDIAYWGLAIQAANYLRNRSPSINLNFKTPFEVMFDRPLNLKHLKIFGCRAYPLILLKSW